ncbi:RNA-binding protein, partial [Striga asiatica]
MTSRGGIDVGLMDNGSRKRRREDVENDEEESDIIVLLLISLVAVLGSWYHNKYFIKEVPMKNDVRAQRREIWMRSLCRDPTCFKQLRLNVHTFNKLCDVLQNEGGLVVSRNVTIKEIVAIFLHILAHDQKNSTTTSIFARNKVMDYIMRGMQGDGDGLRYLSKILTICCQLIIFIILAINDNESMNHKMKKVTKASMSINTKTSKRSFSDYGASTDHVAAVEVKHKQSYVSWNKEIDSHLAFILTEQMALGHKCDVDTWKPQSLHAAVTYLNAKLHLNLTKDNIKNRLKSWKKHFNVVSDIQTNQSGFSWDEDKKMIVVTSDESSSWATYVESHPDAKAMQNKMIENWDDIVLLCGRDRATGQNVETFQEGSEAMDEDVDIEEDLAPSSDFRARARTTKYLARKKQEEKPSGIEIHEVVSVIPGITSEEVFKVILRDRYKDCFRIQIGMASPPASGMTHGLTHTLQA